VDNEFVDRQMRTRNAAGQGSAAEMLSQLHALPVPPDMHEGGAMGAEGRPSRELETCRYMLDLVPTDITNRHRSAYDRLRSAIDRADGCDGLPEAVTHSNLWPGEVVVAPTAERVVIDWTGNGRGPRLSGLANLLWAAGLDGFVDERVIDAIITAYSKHVRLEPADVDRLGAAVLVRSTYYACWRYWRLGASSPRRWDQAAHTSRDISAGMEGHWPEDDLAHAIAERVRASL